MIFVLVMSISWILDLGQARQMNIDLEKHEAFTNPTRENIEQLIKDNVIEKFIFKQLKRHNSPCLEALA